MHVYCCFVGMTKALKYLKYSYERKQQCVRWQNWVGVVHLPTENKAWGNSPCLLGADAGWVP